MIRSRLMLGVLGLVFMGSACGGSSSATPDGGGSAGTGGGGQGGPTTDGGAGALYTGPTTAVAGCNEFTTLFCNRDKQCNSPDASADSVANCVRLDRISFACDLAPASVDFATCLSDVQVLSCESLFSAAPQACVTAINMVPFSDAQTKCRKFVAAACQKSAECEGIDVTADQLQACVEDNSPTLGCDLAISVGSTYDQCLLDVANRPCSDADAGTTADGGGTLSSCETAITFADQ